MFCIKSRIGSFQGNTLKKSTEGGMMVESGEDAKGGAQRGPLH